MQVGCRILVPFGPRKMTGVIVACYNEAPATALREALRLIDSEPVLPAEMISLGKWISGYYCAPLGEVWRSMLPLASEFHSGKVYSLTDAGRDASRQLLFEPAPDDYSAQLLRALEVRPLSAGSLKKKFPLADKALRSLEKKGFVFAEQKHELRDPLRAASENLRVQWNGAETPQKLPKAQRELLAFLHLHPGSHNLAAVEQQVKNASQAARALGRKGLLTVVAEEAAAPQVSPRAPHSLNAAQQAAYEQISNAIQSREFHTLLLHGVTGSGKTEVYLKAIDSTLAAGRSALLMVPEIALTPAMAGQFFGRFGNQVAILHSAFSDSERTGQWRKIRSGKAGVVVGTRSGVFAPVQNLGLIVVDEEHDGSYKQEETPRYHGRDVAIVRAQHAGACVVLGSATPSLESRYNAERGKYTLLQLPARIESRPMPRVELIDMRQEFLETRQQATFSRPVTQPTGNAHEKPRANHCAAEPAGIFQFCGVPCLRRAHSMRKLLTDLDLSPARPTPALPLLQLCGKGAFRMPQMRQRTYLLFGHWFGKSGRRASPTASTGADRPLGP